TNLVLASFEPAATVAEQDPITLGVLWQNAEKCAGFPTPNALAMSAGLLTPTDNGGALGGLTTCTVHGPLCVAATVPETVVGPVTGTGVLRICTPMPPGGPCGGPAAGACCASDTVVRHAVTTPAATEVIIGAKTLFM